MTIYLHINTEGRRVLHQYLARCVVKQSPYYVYELAKSAVVAFVELQS